MKKILFVTTISGFLPQFESNDVKLLKEMGCEIHYASNFRNPIYEFDKEILKEQGVILHHIDVEKSPFKLANFTAIKQVKKIIDECEIDIVHCHNPMGGVCARVAARLSKREPYVIYTAHGFHFYEGAPIHNWIFYYTVERVLANWTDQIITINKEDYERAKTFKLKPGGQVAQIHGVGVNEEKFVRLDDEQRQKLRRKLQIPEDAFLIVTAAELNDNKNHKVVIDALNTIKQKGNAESKQIYYFICGKGPLRLNLEEKISHLGLTKQIRLLGFRTDMPNILSCADCFVFPSKREGLGIAAVEALLCGVPLIVSDNRGTREYAIDTVNSIVCKTNKPEEYASAIQKLLADREYRQLLASRARSSAKGFTINEVEKTMKRVYETWVNR